MKRIWIFLLLFGSNSVFAQAEKKAAKVLWDEWYTVHIFDEIPFSYYNEKVEDRGDQIHFQQMMWKKDRNNIIEEHMGLLAKNTLELTPILYNFFTQVDGVHTTVIDGTMNDKGQLHIKVRSPKGIRSVNRALPKGVFLSTFFPVWITKHAKDFKKARTKVLFKALIEDNDKENFPMAGGWVRLDAPDATAKKTGTKKYTVYFRESTNQWWIKPSGAVLQIKIPSQNAFVEISTKEKAKKFLDKK